MEYNRKQDIEIMIPHVEKLIKFLRIYGIEFLSIDRHIDNIVLTRGEDVHKISHHCFYRFSGMCVTYKRYFKNFSKANCLTEEDRCILAERNMKALQDPKNHSNRQKISHVKLIKIDNDMYINQYMKAIILHMFNIEYFHFFWQYL